MINFPMASKPHILLVGCGKMGAALLRGWLETGSIAHVDVLEPNPLPFADPRVARLNSANEIDPAFDMAVLAVKPQILRDVCAVIKPHVIANKPVLSIAAGQTAAAIEQCFHAGQSVIRAMPNLPASIGHGMTGAYANKAAAAHIDTADALLRAVGECVWLKEETLLDAVTAVSGSGPAYVFYLIECLQEAAIMAGLPKDMAGVLARQTVMGAGALAAEEKDLSATTLRENVTSPGGTTAAALSVLMDGRWQDILTEAVLKAKARSEELSS